MIIEHRHSVVFSRSCRLVPSTDNTTTRVPARRRKTQAVKWGKVWVVLRGREEERHGQAG